MSENESNTNRPANLRDFPDFSLKMFENFDAESCMFYDGKLKGFKLMANRHGIVVQRGTFSIVLDKDYMKNLKSRKKPIDEDMIVENILDRLSTLCGLKLYDSVLKNFKTPDFKRSPLKFNKTSLPKELLEMPTLFFYDDIERKPVYELGLKNDAVRKAIAKNEPAYVYQTTKTALEKLKEDTGLFLLAKCGQFARANATHMDEGAIEDLETMAVRANDNFFNVVEKNVLPNGKTTNAKKNDGNNGKGGLGDRHQ